MILGCVSKLATDHDLEGLIEDRLMELDDPLAVYLWGARVFLNMTSVMSCQLRGEYPVWKGRDIMVEYKMHSKSSSITAL